MKTLQIELFLILFISTLSLCAQQRVDALKSQIAQAESDSLRIALQFELVDVIGESRDLKAREEAITLVQEILKTIDDNNLASPFFQNIKTQSLQNLATFKLNGKKLSEALEWQQKAIDNSIKNKDTITLGVGYLGLGAIQYNTQKTIEAKRSYLKSIDLLQRLNTEESRSFQAQSLIYLGHILIDERKLDSARLVSTQALRLDGKGTFGLAARSSLAQTYQLEGKHQQAQEMFQELLDLTAATDFKSKSSNYQNLASSYYYLGEYKKGIAAIDSALYYEKQSMDEPLPRRMINILAWKDYLLYDDGQYKKAYDTRILYQKYKDTINDIEEVKRLNQLEYDYKLNQEKERAAAAVKAEASKKQLYFVLMFFVLLLGLVSIYFILKGKKQKIAIAESQIQLKEMETVKSQLALATRENELKKIVVDNSITEEVLNQTLDEIKDIITIQNESERKQALKSLSVSLLSEKSRNKSATSLQEYLEDVHIDFKIHLETKFPKLNTKEKELVCLIKLGFTTDEMSKALNTTISAVKSTRYRLRKKLEIEPSTDIIRHIEDILD